MSVTDIAAADEAQRFWRGGDPGPIRLGSEQHLRLFSRMLLDTFNPYKPAIIDWPQLDAGARDRLVGLPIWDIAVQTEGKASINVMSYADAVADPLLKQAVELNGFEEGRHKTVLANMVEAYGIKLAPEPPYPAPSDAEWAFMKTGYSECIDSFFAFGLFELAKRSGYFPPELVATFEPVMQEEGRHITFFINWAAWHRRNLSWWRRIRFELKVARVWAFLIWERMSIARGLGGKTEDANFTVTGSASVGVEVTTGELMDICLAENDRRLAGYDPRLLRPKMVPRLVRFARRFMGKKKGQVEIGSEAHKELFCRHFKATYQDYDPATLPWPELDADALARLRSVPFWQQVLHTELRAGAIVQKFAVEIDDPLLREAVDLQGFEEARHAALIREMIRRYGIEVQEMPLNALPADIETAFKDFGFGECMDSFLGFGVFKIAREAGFLPESMFKIFETLMYEETRHIVFFVNWMAYRQVRQGRGAAWRRGLASLRFYTRALRRLVDTARSGAEQNDGKDFSATQASMFLEGFTFRRFLEDCYAENARRMSVMDEGLLRPSFLPALAKVALRSLRLWSRRPEAAR
ncbi:MAG TPA: ferritin-like domain-containing protein [Stellaceae bacterium]|nr:ferritin-like domain-containing protein [Stellaceae bacterium]